MKHNFVLNASKGIKTPNGKKLKVNEPMTGGPRFAIGQQSEPCASQPETQKPIGKKLKHIRTNGQWGGDNALQLKRIRTSDKWLPN